MEAHLGRKLERREHVHHINGDTLDNRLQNLAVMDAADHISGHVSLGSRWAVKYAECITCHSTARRHLSKGQCTACYQRTRYLPVSRETAK
jgi:7-cyano-7-deazaguanine synthase in queuosine biosynthesis